MIPQQPDMMAAARLINDVVWGLNLEREEVLGLLCAIYACFAISEVPASNWREVEAEEVQRTQLHLRAAQQAAQHLARRR